MQHPLEFIPLQMRRPSFYFFLVFTLVIFGVFGFLDQPLRTFAAPNGIISFELARTPENAEKIVHSWSNTPLLDIFPAPPENSIEYAAFGLGFDYLFMPVYAIALSLGLLLAGANKVGWYSNLTVWMGWGAFAAALFDAVENYALLRMLTGNINSSFPLIASLCATIKFTLLIAGIFTALAGNLVRK